MVAAAPPTPLRIPLGPGTYEMLGAAQQAALQELDTAGALIGRAAFTDDAVVG